MTELSIITSLGPSYLRFLPDAARSVALLGHTHEVQWIVGYDGDLPAARHDDHSGRVDGSAGPPELREAAEIATGSGASLDVVATVRAAGTFAARNHALSVARGRKVMNLDADDVLHPVGVNAALLRPETWTLAQSVDWDGGLLPSFLPLGPVAPGVVSDAWHLLDAPPLSPGALVVNRDLLVAMGGWGAIAFAGDTMLMLAVTEMAPGFVLEEPLFSYRAHPEQYSSLDAKPISRPERHALMWNRVQSLRKLGLSAAAPQEVASLR